MQEPRARRRRTLPSISRQDSRATLKKLLSQICRNRQNRCILPDCRHACKEPLPDRERNENRGHKVAYLNHKLIRSAFACRHNAPVPRSISGTCQQAVACVDTRFPRRRLLLKLVFFGALSLTFLVRRLSVGFPDRQVEGAGAVAEIRRNDAMLARLGGFESDPRAGIAATVVVGCQELAAGRLEVQV